MDHNSQHSILEGFAHEKGVLVGAEGNTAWVGKFAENNWLEHADGKVNCEDATTWGFEGALAKGARIREEKQIVLFREHH